MVQVDTHWDYSLFDNGICFLIVYPMTDPNWCYYWDYCRVSLLHHWWHQCEFLCWFSLGMPWYGSKSQFWYLLSRAVVSYQYFVLYEVSLLNWILNYCVEILFNYTICAFQFTPQKNLHILEIIFYPCVLYWTYIAIWHICLKFAHCEAL